MPGRLVPVSRREFIRRMLRLGFQRGSVFTPRRQDYDLVQQDAVSALLEKWRCFYVQSH